MKVDGAFLGLFLAALGCLWLLREGHPPTRYPTTRIEPWEFARALPVGIVGAFALMGLVILAAVVAGP
jgi:hypothetical protein